jgi:DNA-binding phage protein
MAKTKTLKKQKTSSEGLRKINLNKAKGVHKSTPTEDLLDREQTGLAMLECLENNDPDGVIEVIGIYLAAVNKTKLRAEIDLPKSTMYSIFKHRNPTLKTLAKVLYASMH